MANSTPSPAKIRKVLSTRNYPSGAVIIIVEEERAVNGRRGGGISNFVLILFEDDRIVERRHLSDPDRIDPIAEGMLFEHQRRKAC